MEEKNDRSTKPHHTHTHTHTHKWAPAENNSKPSEIIYITKERRKKENS